MRHVCAGRAAPCGGLVWVVEKRRGVWTARPAFRSVDGALLCLAWGPIEGVSGAGWDPRRLRHCPRPCDLSRAVHPPWLDAEPGGPRMRSAKSSHVPAHCLTRPHARSFSFSAMPLRPVGWRASSQRTFERRPPLAVAVPRDRFISTRDADPAPPTQLRSNVETESEPGEQTRRQTSRVQKNRSGRAPRNPYWGGSCPTLSATPFSADAPVSFPIPGVAVSARFGRGVRPVRP